MPGAAILAWVQTGQGVLMFFKEREEVCRSTEAAAQGPSHQVYGTLLQDL